MAFPLYTGLTPKREKEAVFKRFVEEITKNKPHLDTESPGLPILLKYIIGALVSPPGYSRPGVSDYSAWRRLVMWARRY